MRGNAVRRALKVKCRFSRETIISVESGRTHTVLPDSLFPRGHLRRQGARPITPRHKDGPQQKHIPHTTYTRGSRSATTFPKARGMNPHAMPTQKKRPQCTASPDENTLMTLRPPQATPQHAHLFLPNNPPQPTKTAHLKSSGKSHRKVIPQQRRCKTIPFAEIFNLKIGEK